MKKVLVSILCIMLLTSCLYLSGCDIYKKYNNRDIINAYAETYNDGNLEQFFDEESKDFQIVWSQGVRNEFDNSNSLFQKLDTVYYPILKGAFDCFYSMRDGIADKWEKDYTTNIYHSLIDFRDSLKKFASGKDAFEYEMQAYTTGMELTNIQKNHYDILAEYMQDLISKSISLGENTLKGIIINNYEDYYSVEQFKDNFSWVYLKTYANLIRLDLIKIAYNFDIKTSYMVSDRTFLFDTKITREVKNLNDLIKLKCDKVKAHGFIESEEMKDKVKLAITNNAQLEDNISNYFASLNKLNVQKLQANKENIPAYIDSLSNVDRNNYDLIMDFNGYYSTYMAGNITSILNEI